MRGILVFGLVGFLMAGAGWAVASKPPVKGGATARRVDRGGWPDTREGAIARRWVEAFSAGDSAMRRFITNDLTPESLARKSADERMETYRQNHERFGKLVLATVVKSKPGELTASLMASDASLHEFIFAVQTKPPYRLLSISMREKVQSGGHGFLDHFHH